MREKYFTKSAFFPGHLFFFITRESQDEQEPVLNCAHPLLKIHPKLPFKEAYIPQPRTCHIPSQRQNERCAKCIFYDFFMVFFKCWKGVEVGERKRFNVLKLKINMIIDAICCKCITTLLGIYYDKFFF